MRKIISLIAFVLFHLFYSETSNAQKSVSSFATGGHIVYHLQPGTINNQRAVISAAYDGTVLCHTPNGKTIWKTATGEGFPFDLVVADIDGDGQDESFVASSDGVLYVISSKGKLLWKYQSKAPLWQVAVDNSGEQPMVLAGGIDRMLTTLDAHGDVVGQVELNSAIRLMEVGDFLGEGKNQVAVVTTKHTNQGYCVLYVYRLPNLEKIWSRKIGDNGDGSSGRIFSMDVSGFEKNGRDNMYFGLEAMAPHKILKVDGAQNLEMIETKGYMAFNWQAIHPGYEWEEGESIPLLPYEMNLLACAEADVKSDGRIFQLYGRRLIVRDANGSVLSILEGNAGFSGISYDEQTGNLYLGSDIAGGDDIYVINTKQKGWENEFEKKLPVGNLAKLKQNTQILMEQLEAFKAPPYQSNLEKNVITLQQNPKEIKERYTDKYTFKNVQFATTYKYIERYAHGIKDPELVKSWEAKHSSKVSTQEKILEDVRRYETNGEHFLLMGGHGSKFGIDFYIGPETMVEILKIAPNTFEGVVFAELESVGEELQTALKNELIPLAKEFHKYGKKILLRNKNIFWNALVYLDFWQEVFHDPICRDVFVVSMEETNSRTQEWSLSGKTGLWLSVNVENLSARAVTDNANWNRSWEWGQTRYLSNILRSLCIRRLYGADFTHINLYTENKTDLLPLYLLIEKGIIPAPKKEDILSISEIAIGMKTPDPEFMEHGMSGKSLDNFKPLDGSYVFERLDAYWGGAPIPKYDFTRLAFNSKRRMTNFLPQFPYGMVTTISDKSDLKKTPWINKMILTDGRYWYNNEGRKIEAEAYVEDVKELLKNAAKKLPIRVTGDVSWAAVRIDNKHVRVVLIDPGYFDPAGRDVEIIFQHLKGVKCTDILSNEELKISENKVSTSVPLGTLRILDIAHE